MSKPTLNALIGAVSLAAMFVPSTAALAEQKMPEGTQQANDSRYASEVPKDVAFEDKNASMVASDGDQTTIPVAEEIDFVLESGSRTHENFDENLKKVARLDYFGTRYVSCDHYPVEVHAARPNRVQTVVGADKPAAGATFGLSADAERALRETYDFDTPILDLERNRHSYTPIGMVKLPGFLAWKLRADLPQGYHRIVYIDSHTGDVVKFSILNAKGAKVLDVVQHDFRVIEGLRLPFAVDYRGPGGEDLADDRFQRIEVGRDRS